MRAGLGRFTGSMALLGVLVFLGCSGSPTGSAGKDPADTTGNKPGKGLFGTLVDGSGSPMQGATVWAVPADAVPLPKYAGGTTGSRGAAYDSALTDSAGVYVIAKLAAGTYNLLGISADRKLVVLIQGVKYEGGETRLQVKSATLEAPGKISGTARWGGEGLAGLACWVPGTTFQATSDDSGNFTLTGIPAGSFTVSCRKDGLQTVTDSNITVSAGGSSRLPSHDLSADPAYPPPAPAGLEARYDTAAGRVTLLWRKAQVSDLAGYAVYRNTPGGTPAKVSSGVLKDTTYAETVVSPADTAGKEYEYRVKSQDDDARLSADYSKAVLVKAVPPARVRTVFAWKTAGTLGDSASIKDTVTAAVTWSNPGRRIRKLSLFVDGKIVPAATRQDSAFSGTDSVKASSAKTGRIWIYAEATDDAGAAWWDSITVRYVQDIPVADAGKDTLIGIHTQAHFQGRAAQAFGKVAMYKWDYDGNGVYDDSSTTGIGSHAYDHETIYTAKLLVRDDDGNEATDIRQIDVANLPPKVLSVRKDTTVSINDPVAFHGTGSDTDGTLASHGWDFDGNGSIDTATDTATTILRGYPKAGVYNAVYRVTDDDGKIAERTVAITVLQDMPVGDAGKDTAVTLKDLVRLKGRATDGYGAITAWAWDIGGTGTFKAIASGDTTVRAPSAGTAAWPCILRVTDDDGNVDLDTLLVSVVADIPKVDAGNDTTVSINDVVRLRGKATDYLGIIVERAWDVGGTGTWRVSATGDTDIVAPASATAGYLCRFRAMDDDSQVVYDSLRVNVVRDAPQAYAGPDTTVGVGLATTFAGTSAQNYGSIAMHSWDWEGNGIWDDSGSAKTTTTVTYSTGGIRTLIYAVRDDDGNVSADTVTVTAVSYVGGLLAANATWIKASSPYVLTSDLRVPAGMILTISAGVKLSGAHSIVVAGGSLIAVGIAADSVVISSPIRFEGTALATSQVSYIRMAGMADAIRLGDESEAAQASVKNSGTLTVTNSSFFKTRLVTDGWATGAGLYLHKVALDSAQVVTTAGQSEGILLRSATLANSTVTSGSTTAAITLDSTVSNTTTFLLGLAGAQFAFTASTFSYSGLRAESGTDVPGPVSFTGCGLDNTTLNLPNTVVNLSRVTGTWSAVAPQVRIGRGTIHRAGLTGANAGVGLEITGYQGNTITGATTVDSSEVKNFAVGVKVLGFGTLSMTGDNFVTNTTYDLENQAAAGFNAADCYWSGAVSTVNIDTRIRDNTDDPAFGKVNFTNPKAEAYAF